MVDSFIQLLKFSIGVSDVFPKISDEGWVRIFEIAQKQSLLGVVFEGIKKNKETKIDKKLLLKWLCISEQIRQTNKKQNQVAAKQSFFFKNNGFRSCILKGQGNTIYYPNPYIRTCGDIDIWLEGNYKRIVSFVKRKWPGQQQYYHHIDIPPVDGVAIEVHYRPSYMRAPWYNKRLQKWFVDNEEAQFSNEISLPDDAGYINIPTPKFNLVFQLSHLYNHYFTEGIGLRQFVDYYFVLRGLAESAENAERYKGHTDDTDNTDSYLTQKLTNTNLTNHTNSYRNSLEDTLRHLGLWKFAGAVMYVMREVFALEEQYMIAPVDERRGKTLLNEILKGGNFGQHSGLTNHSTGGKYFAKTWRNMKLVREYPAEALCEPVFRTWHFFWRLAHR